MQSSTHLEQKNLKEVDPFSFSLREYTEYMKGQKDSTRVWVNLTMT